MNLNIKAQVQRFTARTRVYTLAILGVTVGGVYLSIALFLELGGRIGPVYAAAATGVCVIFLGAIPWLLMSFGRYDPPAVGDVSSGKTGSDSSSKDPIVRAELIGEDASRQITSIVKQNALLSIGVAAAAGMVVGASPKARSTVNNLINTLMDEQSRRR